MFLEPGLKLLSKLATHENIVILVLLGILFMSWGVIVVLWKDNQSLRKELKELSERLLATLLTNDTTLTKVIDRGTRDYDNLRELIKSQCELIVAKLLKK